MFVVKRSQDNDVYFHRRHLSDSVFGVTAMLSLYNKIVLFVLACQLCFSLVKASEICGNGRYCTDRGSSSAYCCNRNYLGNYQCCYRTRYYTSIWSLWYFWFGLAIFLLLISGCIAGCRRRQLRMRMQQTMPQTHTVHVATVTMAGPVGQQNPGYVKPTNDLPPSYNQIQQQGISSQFQEFSKQETAPPYPPQGYAPPPYPATQPVPYPTAQGFPQPTMAPNPALNH
ncbi:uncharacterized protein LOC143465666 [Clavelina lepadiformis]|uniref:uncharacterized protein LOC143465666 n=1 Tax=Clavelina lepadiformis TaxID=159417 RepID=UPI004040FB2B